MLIVRGTKKLRDRVKVQLAPAAAASTTTLGDWFATVLFWRPQVALLVNARTLLPVFTEFAPAAAVLDRAPTAIESVLRAHGVDEAVLGAERDAMRDVQLAPTNDRSVVGVMNELAFHAELHYRDGLTDLRALSLRVAGLPLGPLRQRSGFPDRELAAVLGQGRPGNVVASPSQRAEAAISRVQAKPGGVYQLKVTLTGTKPPIWRRVLVDGASTLDHIHDVIQAAFGWWNYHLHEFEIDGHRYGVPDPDDDWGDPPLDERRIQLQQVAGEAMSFDYTYDFGDDWRHRVSVEKVLRASAVGELPACVDGRRACPPEDCGGTGGYEELVEILTDPSHPEHAERREWCGDVFDPEHFDRHEFTENLRQHGLARFDDFV